MSKGNIMALSVALIAFVSFAASVHAIDCFKGQTRPCGSNIGACQAGVRVCHDGNWSDCIGGTLPSDEICDNGIDDDCDGATDECLTFAPVLIITGLLLFVIMGLLIKLGF
ncbi:MAG: hypothetical protein DRO99_00405 [Candidatus Aenigmatarchaeota archaeon]|nr:MAG: hypothetical protein DRO99_00405 [Candidatus Aenigmarchaeota archaeon]